MRVIAGSLGGRRFDAPPGRRTRPTAERVREAVFAMLDDVSESAVLDLFAGSGALGIEALSRGAARAVFVEREAAAARVLRENLARLGLGTEAAEVRRSEVAGALQSARDRKETYDLVFIDPPYGRAREWASKLSKALPPLLVAGARVVVESDRREPLGLELEVERQRRYGDTSITIHRNR
jgi:16S rRNA (guanine966-N2)-methyltransferase